MRPLGVAVMCALTSRRRAGSQDDAAWGMHGVGTQGAGITDGWHHSCGQDGHGHTSRGPADAYNPTVDHTQCSEGMRIVRGCEEWLCVHMAECHWPELEVWCKDRLRVCAAACVVASLACVAAEETGAGCRRRLCLVMAKARSERRAGVRATFWINDSVRPLLHAGSFLHAA